jgi:hypothetical protein
LTFFPAKLDDFLNFFQFSTEFFVLFLTLLTNFAKTLNFFLCKISHFWTKFNICQSRKFIFWTLFEKLPLIFNFCTKKLTFDKQELRNSDDFWMIFWRICDFWQKWTDYCFENGTFRYLHAFTHHIITNMYVLSLTKHTHWYSRRWGDPVKWQKVDNFDGVEREILTKKSQIFLVSGLLNW